MIAGRRSPAAVAIRATLRAACATLGVAAAVAISRPARADSTLVVLVRPATEDARATEVLNLARGELSADRFDVILAEPTAPDGRATLLARSATDAGADVTIGLFIDPDARAIDLWLVDRRTDRTLVRRVDGPSGSADESPAVLARRTVDTIRASVYELLVQSIRSRLREPAEHPAAPAPPVEPTPPVEAAPLRRLALEVGGAGVGGVGGVGPALLPVVRLRLAIDPTWSLRATGAWLGTRPRVESSDGASAATIDQGVALLEGVAELGAERALRPVVSLGAGMAYVGVEGQAAPPSRSLDSHQFAFVVDGGAGLDWRVAPRFDLTLEAHLLVTDPGIGIRFSGAQTATLGRPLAMVTLTLASWI